MTKERPHPEMDDVSDPLVSQRYGEIASERVPADLDRAILRQARQNVGKQYSKSLTWLRPMAWAATIGLSLAIVIELSNVPMVTSDMYEADVDSPAEAPASVMLEEAEMSLPERQNAEQSATPARKESLQLEQRARKSIDGEGRISLDNVSQFSKVKAPPAENMPALNVQSLSPAPRVIPAASELKDEIVAADQNRADADMAYQNAAREADSMVLEEIVVVNDAAPLARSQEPGTTASGVAARAATQSGAFAAAIDEPCDTQVQETPETWLECIDGLDEAGFGEIADVQREQLQEAFPDFELP